jgi:transcriptional regulator with XRE-family HTH domain
MPKNSPKSRKIKSVELAFGQILRQLRQERGLSQEGLALESGYHRTYISQLERGQKNPSLKTIFQLAKALNVEPSEIIEHVQSLAAPC